MCAVNFLLEGVWDRPGICVVKKHGFNRCLERRASGKALYSVQVGIFSERFMLAHDCTQHCDIVELSSCTGSITPGL